MRTYKFVVAQTFLRIRAAGARMRSDMGHEQTSRHVRYMSVLPLKADIHKRGLHVRLVPLTDIAESNAHARNAQCGSTVRVLPCE